jgi:hypothetical protein
MPAHNDAAPAASGRRAAARPRLNGAARRAMPGRFRQGVP